MPIGPRLFVFIVFSILGASFLATTGMLASEFKDNHLWLDFASMESHLFVFFPALGILALVAFYVPSIVFVDLYWRYVRYGRIRFLFGFLVAATASYLIAGIIRDNPRRALWESAPHVLAADKGEPAGCEKGTTSCLRLPMLAALHDLREVSRSRLGLDSFVRNCSPGPGDPLIEQAHTPETRRFCFASTSLSSPLHLQTDEECCKAEARLIATVRANYDNLSTRSMTSEVHAALLPLKVFFLLVVFFISVLLALHHRKVEKNYQAFMTQIEIGLFIGAICMLFFPLMSQAFLQSSDALNGSAGRGRFSVAVPIISFLFMVWVLLIGLFFHRRGADARIVTTGRLIGILASNIGIIKYNLIISIFVWALGAGASPVGLLGLLFSCVCALILMVRAMTIYSPRRGKAAVDPLSQGDGDTAGPSHY
jgi:hypothetical protein